jgi:hypothetical protein
MMRQYRANATGDGFADLTTGGGIPKDIDNRHYAEMLRLVEAGEAEILPADPEPVDNTPTQAEEIAALRKAVKGDMTDLEALEARE